MLGLRTAIAAFACRFNRHVETGSDQPRRRHGGRGVIDRTDADGRIRTLSRRDFSGGNGIVIRPGNREVGIEVESGKREDFQIPGGGRPRLKSAMKICFGVLTQRFIGERALLKARGGLRR